MSNASHREPSMSASNHMLWWSASLQTLPRRKIKPESPGITMIKQVMRRSTLVEQVIMRSTKIKQATRRSTSD